MTTALILPNDSAAEREIERLQGEMLYLARRAQDMDGQGGKAAPGLRWRARACAGRIHTLRLEHVWPWKRLGGKA